MGVIKAKDKTGKPLKGVTIKAKQINHAFRYGVNLFFT